MSKEDKPKSIGLWVAAIIILLGLTQPWKWNWGSSEEISNSTAQNGYVEPQKNKNVDSNLIVIRPGDQFTLEINSEEWSPMLDATYNGMHTNIDIRTDHFFKYPDGTTEKVCKGKPIKLKSNRFRIKTVKGKYTAVIKTAMNPINKSLYN